MPDSPRIASGSHVTLHYRIAVLVDGTEREVMSTFGAQPATLTIGAGDLAEPLEVRLLGPIVVHLALAKVCEAVMRVPLISTAQVHTPAEGVVEASPPAPEPPADLMPQTPFSPDVIRAGLPEPGPFGCRDLRWWPA